MRHLLRRRRDVSGTVSRRGAASAATAKGLAAIQTNPAEHSAALRAKLATLAILKIALRASHCHPPDEALPAGWQVGIAGQTQAGWCAQGLTCARNSGMPGVRRSS